MVNGNCKDKLFIDSFYGFGLDQCISGHTHNKGRIALKHIGTRIEPIKNSKNILGLKEILRIFSKVK